MTRTQAYWTCQLGGWGLYVVFRIVLSSFFSAGTWERTIGFVVLGTAGLVYTHAFRFVVKTWGWTWLSLRRLVPRVMLAALVISTLSHCTGDVVGRYLLELSFYDEVESGGGLLLASIANGWILSMLWSVIYFGVHAVWNYRQAEVDKWKLEAQAEAARLQALKLQLNPHFFFNSLNSVRALIAEDPPRAQRMVTRLARLLRTTLQVNDVKTVLLEDELVTVRTYLELEKVRFEDRLQYRIDAGEAARGRPVPFLLMQTLVENSVKHGIAQQQGGGTITIEASVCANGDATRESAALGHDVLHLRVANPGTLQSDQRGTGLQNAQERLHLLFGEAASLTVTDTDDDRVVATARLPGRPTAPNPAAPSTFDSSTSPARDVK